tara:strand:+ start:26185 stop:26511 length:327 start_codon:yes stop_codon:yes gene_type:complete
MEEFTLRISKGLETPARVVDNLEHAEEFFRDLNYSTLSKDLLMARDTILTLITHADALVHSIEWNKRPDDAIAEYIHYRGYEINKTLNKTLTSESYEKAYIPNEEVDK